MKLLKRPLHNSIGGPLWWTLSIGGLVLSGWGFVPHRHLHAKAWSYLPHDMRAAWPVHPTTLMELATHADTRKHTDSLEAERHYLDLDDLRSAGLDVWVCRGPRPERSLQMRTVPNCRDGTASCLGIWNGPIANLWKHGLLQTACPSMPSSCRRPPPTWDITSQTHMCRCAHFRQLQRPTNQSEGRARPLGNASRRVDAFSDSRSALSTLRFG